MNFTDNSLYYIGQCIGILAFFIGLTVFIQRDDKKLKQRLVIYSSCISLHYFFLGATPAGVSALLTSVRTLISIYFRKKIFMYIFIFLVLALAAPDIKHGMEILPVSGTVMSTIAFFTATRLKLRVIMWLSTAQWVAYNLWLGTIGGTLIETSFLIINGIAILRFRLLLKKGIDPFSHS
ncbi:YgjV family protein [Enterobacteriaceae bacterium ESL0689]|nr:YgjV family protein [Enterobacteriaceae bacterium ESL0689]